MIKKQPKKIGILSPTPGIETASTLAPAVVFLAAFGLYLLCLGPLFTDGDSPETVTAGQTLGIPHPPGYALHILLTRLFTLLPLGNPAWRGGLESACLGALGAVLLGALLGKIPSVQASGKFSPVWKAIGSLLLTFSPFYWEGALSPKSGVYLLQACLGMALVGSLLKKDTVRKNRVGFFVPAFLVGLGFSNDWMIHFFFAALAFLWIFNPSIFSGKRFFSSCAFFLLGLSPLLTLPLRAHLHPALNLGSPDSLGLFGDYILRKYYASSGELSTLGAFGLGNLSTIHSLFSSWVSQLAYLGEHWVSFTAPVLGLALLGLVLGRRIWDRKLFWLLGLPLFLSAALSLDHTAPEAYWLLDHFLIPCDWVLCFYAVAGASALGQKTSLENGRWIWAALLALFPLWFLTTHWNSLRQGEQTLRYDYGVNLLESAPRGSLLFADQDEDYFPLYYLQLVENKRPDLVVIPAFTLFEPWGVAQVERTHPEFGLDASTRHFPDPISRFIYASSEITVKNRKKTPIVFSYFGGAYHRYYLSLHPELTAKTSGVALLLNEPGETKGPFLPMGLLRLRLSGDPSDGHPSLSGILEIYRKLGFQVP